MWTSQAGKRLFLFLKPKDPEKGEDHIFLCSDAIKMQIPGVSLNLCLLEINLKEGLTSVEM